MSWFRRLLGSPRARRGVAASAVVLAVGGLVLARSPVAKTTLGEALLAGQNGAEFSGPGARGTLSLSHELTPSGGREDIFAELRLRANDERMVAEERAPLSLAIVFDTSGSMSGEKIETSKRSVRTLIERMRDDDEVAFVRYDSNHSLVQSLARVGRVRQELLHNISDLQASGGTNIPPALRAGVRELSRASAARVRRVVLVSDGLDSTRAEAESIARSATDEQVTVSALGIGLDFDEGYMAAVSSAGRGNFGFVRDAVALAGFLQRELDETATTVVTDARARLTLPAGMRFVRAVGADANVLGDEVELRIGSLFAGDERRVIVQLTADAEHGQRLDLASQVSWRHVRGDQARAVLPALRVTGERDRRLVLERRDGAVLASATSALASLRQLAATEAFSRGDTATAQRLLDENLAELEQSAAAAPQAARPALERQRAEVAEAKSAFAAPAASPKAREASKTSAEKNSANLSRSAF